MWIPSLSKNTLARKKEKGQKKLGKFPSFIVLYGFMGVVKKISSWGRPTTCNEGGIEGTGWSSISLGHPGTREPRKCSTRDGKDQGFAHT